MYRSTHIFLLILVISLGFIDPGYAENKQSIATAEFLSVLAKNVATVLSPTLVGELHDGRPNRTAVNATTIEPTTSSESPKITESTTALSKLSGLEADTVRSAQTQSEVRPVNNGFPFNFDDNTYRYNYPSINSQGLPGRPDFSSGPFVNPGYYNSDLYRAYAGQTAPEGNLQRGETVGVSPVETVGDGQTGRSPDSLDPSVQNLHRFRNFERFPFNNQFSGGPGNFPNPPPFSSQRQEGRFGQSLIDALGQNLQGNPNFPNNPNYQNSLVNNYPRNSFQSLGDPFQQHQQGFRSSNFDFLPSQRFQNNFDNYPRSLRRGPNFPGFYPVPYVTGLRDTENFVSPSSRIDAKNTEQASSSVLTAESEVSNNGNVKNSTVNGAPAENPEILSVAGRIRFGRLLLPTLDDYDDLRFRPDAFREYFFTPDNNGRNKTNNAAATNNHV